MTTTPKPQSCFLKKNYQQGLRIILAKIPTKEREKLNRNKN